MAIFLDTGFFVGLVDPNDPNYNRCLELLRDLQMGTYGQIFTSYFIMAESATIVGVRTRKHPLAMKTIQEYFIGTDQIAGILDFEEAHVKEAWALFLKTNAEKKAQIISFIDCTNIILCQHYSIDTILAFDRHFEGFLARIF